MRIASVTATVIVSVTLVSCGNDTPTTPTQVGSVRTPLPSGPAPSPPSPVEQLTMTGAVVDDDGRPIPNATLTRWFGFYEQQSVSTDGSGKYRLQFGASRGSEAGPPGAQNSVAFVTLEAPGYALMSQYILAPTNEFVHSFRMHRIQRIAAGTSAQMTIAPDDSVCGWDWSPGRETVCRFLEISVPANGTLTVEVAPLDGSSKLEWVEVWNNLKGVHANPAVLPASADSNTHVSVAVEWGATKNQSFLVRTAWTP